MPDDHKVFDISRPMATPASRPIIAEAQPQADPMVRHHIEVSTPGSPAPASEPMPVAQAPEVAEIPVSQAPPQAPAEIVPTFGEPDSSVLTPALPGAPTDLPRFGELQHKVDAHPLFNGQTEDRVKIRRRFPRFALPLAGLVVFAAIAFLFINSSAGASYLPFKILKQRATAQPVIAPIKVVTNPVVTKPVSLVPDSYAGWNTNCVNALKACVKYPTDWVANPYGGFENQAQTEFAALSVENVKDKSTADALVVSIDDFNTPNSALKVVGVIVGTQPGYAVYDTAYINANGLKPGVTKNIIIGNYTFNGPTGQASLVGTPDTKGAAAIQNVDQARAWFVSADAQQVLKVVRSFYYQ